MDSTIQPLAGCPHRARCAGRTYGLGAALLLATSLLAPVTADAGSIYRWVDETGHIHFSDKPPVKVDESMALKVFSYREAPTVADFPAQALPQPESPDTAAPGPVPAVLYSAAWCPYCKQARQYLRRRGIAFSEYDVETTAKGKRDYKRLNGGGVPILLVDSRRMNGFSAATFESLWRRATRSQPN